ncbi:MAG TPA: hypothetical protein VNC11_10740 [Gemmatimonadaceae bacterium]|nr:hypothetical protein [Gemmatimonadaceae bacterium]
MEASSSVVLGLSDLHPVVAGAAATLVAAVALAGWIGIGSLFLPASQRYPDQARLAGSLLIGSAITAFVYALMTRAGIVDGAIVVVAIAWIASIAMRFSEIRLLSASTTNSFREAIGNSKLVRIVAIPIAVLLWIYAVAPPRDGDVMRYHLAHIRQIISDGRWQPIADYHYAFPFGWSLNYLPFERLHLPQAAALVNVALWLVVVAGLFGLAQKTREGTLARVGILALFVHPFVVRTFASAMVDAYAIMVVYVIALLLFFLDELGDREVALLGFVSWIGVQSRYQHIAWGIAATCVFLFLAVRHRRVQSIGFFSAGGLSAIVLSAPFYLANASYFGNALWPLLIRVGNSSSYADRVAASYTRDMTGQHDASYAFSQLWELISTSSLVPIAALCLILIIAGLFLHSRFRRIAVLGGIFFAIWIIAEPRLYPKHVLLLLPIAAMMIAGIAHRLGKWPRVLRASHVAAAAGLVVMLALSAVLSADYARYVATGDLRTYHRFTWYYSTYNWVNHNTPGDARFLVIVLSGHSYYLDRPYRRADPWLSGTVDWSRVRSGAELSNVLASGGYRYVIYDDRSWKGYVGGSEMERAVNEMIATGGLVPVHEQRETLYTSRAMREFEATNVMVLRVADHPVGS